MRIATILTTCLLAAAVQPALADEAAVAQAIENAAEALRGDEVQYETQFDVGGLPAPVTVTMEGFAFCLPPNPTAPPDADPTPPDNIYGCENDLTIDLVNNGGIVDVTMAAPLLFVDLSTHVLSNGTGYLTGNGEITFAAQYVVLDGCPTLTLVPGTVDVTVSDLDGNFTDIFITLYWISAAPFFLDQLNNQDAEFEPMVATILAEASQQLCELAGSEEPLLGAALLHRNVPNPFNPRTALSYELPGPARVRLQVFDLQGRLVQVLDEGTREAGRHEAIWNGLDQAGRPVPTGAYLCRLETGRSVQTRKLLLLR